MDETVCSTFCEKQKNEENKSFKTTPNLNTMKPKYYTNEDLNCGIIEYNNNTYLVDLNDKDKIINFNASFVFANETDAYPSYCRNYKRVNYLNFIFNYNDETVYYKFKNDNKYDLRKNNVEIYHSYHATIIQTYKTAEYIQGHYLTIGQSANVMKNPLWKIEENGKNYLLMFCEKNTICKLCLESYNKILDFEKNITNTKLTWFVCSNGYIQTRAVYGKIYYIHQIIMNCYGNGKGTKNVSVDHIDRNPLNNSYENLRIATRKEQEDNSIGIISGTNKKRFSKKIIPEGITPEMLPKYVYYNCEEICNEKKTTKREFFRVEHPKLDKSWSTTKSFKVSIIDKLAQATKVVEDLENDIYPTKTTPTLPKYVSLVTTREKPHLVFEKREEDKRLSLKMILPKDYDLHVQIEILNEKIKAKYENYLLN